MSDDNHISWGFSFNLTLPFAATIPGTTQVVSPFSGSVGYAYDASNNTNYLTLGSVR